MLSLRHVSVCIHTFLKCQGLAGNLKKTDQPGVQTRKMWELTMMMFSRLSAFVIL